MLVKHPKNGFAGHYSTVRQFKASHEEKLHPDAAGRTCGG